MLITDRRTDKHIKIIVRNLTKLNLKKGKHEKRVKKACHFITYFFGFF